MKSELVGNSGASFKTGASYWINIKLSPLCEKRCRLKDTNNKEECVESVGKDTNNEEECVESVGKDTNNEEECVESVGKDTNNEE